MPSSKTKITGNSWKGAFLAIITRKQRVVINGVFSDWPNVTSGVPQGGPLLFLLYVNDLDCVVKNSTIKLFPYCYMPQPIPQECSALQDDLTVISNWANRWQLKLNVKL